MSSKSNITAGPSSNFFFRSSLTFSTSVKGRSDVDKAVNNFATSFHFLNLLPLHESSVETTTVCIKIDSASFALIKFSKGYEGKKVNVGESILYTLGFCRTQSVVKKTHHLLCSFQFSTPSSPNNKRVDKKLDYVFPPRRHLSITNIRFDAVQAVVVTWFLALKRTSF